jgi:hypothetical protein
MKEKELRETAAKDAALENAADFNFSEEESNSAINKVKTAAKKYMKSHPSAVGLDGFDVKFLKPAEFRELLKRTFNVMVDAKELGALIHFFNGNAESNLLDCGTFLIKFARLGKELRDEFRLKQLEACRQAELEAAKKHEKIMEDLSSKMEIGIDKNYSEEDKV